MRAGAMPGTDPRLAGIWGTQPPAGGFMGGAAGPAPIETPIPTYANGGEIDGPGGPRDDNLMIMASDGEFVIPADVVRHKGEEFFHGLIDKSRAGQQAMPQGSGKGYADGGPVFGGWLNGKPVNADGTPFVGATPTSAPAPGVTPPPQNGAPPPQQAGTTPPPASGVTPNPAARPAGFGPTTPPPPGATPPPGAGDPWAGWPGQSNTENRSYGRTGLDPRLDALFNQALQSAMSRFSDPNGQQFYSGPTVAGLTPDEIAAQNQMRTTAGNAQPFASSGMDYFNTMLGRATNPQDDPTLNAAIDATKQGITQSATDPGGVFATIRGNAIANGNYGGSRQGIAEGVAQGRLNDTLARTEADMRMTGRSQDLNAAQGVLNAAPNIQSNAMFPSSILSGVGAQNRGVDQANMDAALRAWAYNSYEPDRRLQNLFGLLGSAPLGTTGQTSTTVGSDLVPGANGGTSTAQNLVGGAAAAGGIWNILRGLGIF